MRALNFHHDCFELGEIDLVFEGPREYTVLKKNAMSLPLGELRVPVISLSDLVLMKESSDRAQDRADVEALRELTNEDEKL